MKENLLNPATSYQTRLIYGRFIRSLGFPNTGFVCGIIWGEGSAQLHVGPTLRLVKTGDRRDVFNRLWDRSFSQNASRHPGKRKLNREHANIIRLVGHGEVTRGCRFRDGQNIVGGILRGQNQLFRYVDQVDALRRRDGYRLSSSAQGGTRHQIDHVFQHRLQPAAR